MTAAAPRATRPNLQELLELTSPAARARTRIAETVPVLPPLAPLLPDGGLARGTITEVTDTGLLLALAAGPADSGPHIWTGAINLPNLGLLAGDGYGLPLDRLLLADHVPDDQFPEVLAALAPAVPLLLVRPPTTMPERTATRLTALLRRTGAIVLAHGPWPGAQIRLDVTASTWTGLGDGWGLLQQRQVTVQATGRGRAARPRTLNLLLPNGHGEVAATETASSVRSVPDERGLAAAI